MTGGLTAHERRGSLLPQCVHLHPAGIRQGGVGGRGDISPALHLIGHRWPAKGNRALVRAGHEEEEHEHGGKNLGRSHEGYGHKARTAADRRSEADNTEAPTSRGFGNSTKMFGPTRLHLPSGNQSVDDGDHRHYQEDVDEVAHCEGEVAQQPANDEQDDDDVEEIVHGVGCFPFVVMLRAVRN